MLKHLTVEDKKYKCLHNYWPAETKAESEPYLGGLDVLPSPTFDIGGGVSPCPPWDLRPCIHSVSNSTTTS